MKALVYTDTQKIEYRDEPEPIPENGEVLVKVEAVGICGSDMHAYHGHDARRIPPLILGHEVVGLVQQGKEFGQRFVLNPLMTCGVCYHCQGGRSNLCSKRELIGMRKAGAFAEYVAIFQQNLLAIPQDMDPIIASLTEPAATSLHAIFLAEKSLHRPLSECRVLIIGGGSIGVFAALMVSNKGCNSVMLGDTNRLRRDLIQSMGCCEVFDPLAKQLPDEGCFDLVIDAVGSGRTRAAASTYVASGGVISHVGLQDNDEGLDTRKLTLEEITFLGNYTYSPVDLRAAIDSLYNGSLGKLDWVEKRRLAEGASAFRDIHNGKIASPKVVLLP